MGKLTTHVLDTANGCPAAGMAVRLYRVDEHGLTPVKALRLNHDGRADAPLLEADALTVGRYRLVFEVAPYFRARGRTCPSRRLWTKCRSTLVSRTPHRTTTCRCWSAPGATRPRGGSAPPQGRCQWPQAGSTGKLSRTSPHWNT